MTPQRPKAKQGRLDQKLTGEQLAVSQQHKHLLSPGPVEAPEAPGPAAADNMQAEFRAPRRRTRVQEQYEAPLPASRSPREGTDLRAELINLHVLVCQPDHIQKIYNQV